jgi:hypothetical protein
MGYPPKVVAACFATIIQIGSNATFKFEFLLLRCSDLSCLCFSGGEPPGVRLADVGCAETEQGLSAKERTFCTTGPNRTFAE